jgi:hypothetical protein
MLQELAGAKPVSNVRNIDSNAAEQVTDFVEEFQSITEPVHLYSCVY